jgi:S-formylglutathione hydrolase FrmB
MLMISAYVHPYSNVLNMETDVRLIMPDLNEDKRPLPCIYLCHGGSGDEDAWLCFGGIGELADRYRTAFCLVNAMDSCFTDMAHGFPFATYIGKELPLIMRGLFSRLSCERKDTFICGLSNGGYGALLIGLTYPETFSAIGAFSAGDKADAAPKPFPEGTMDPRIRVFGQREIHGTDYSITHLARTLAASEREKPRVYHACGGKDPWLDMNLIVKECFEDLACPDYDYRYHQDERYGHEWPFWHEELVRFLDYASIR